MSPKAVLLKTGLTPVNTVRPVNTAHPKTAVHSAKSKTHFSKQAQSTAKRPFYKQTTLTRRSVHEAKRHYYTGRHYAVNTARSYSGQVNAVRVKGVNAGKPQHDDKGFVDSGCSRHMTGNIAYLSDFKQFDGGYVAFGGGAYGGKITGKGTLKTDNLDFEDVYFVNELKFNLFSVSQMCDKKNYVLFTDTECLVLSPNFKLPDENQILLKIPRKDNMYSFDMKNIVPKESLTCLVAKATLDESMLWHRRLGHINFKNINKLVKDNLVRGLPTKRFENDQTCVACLKGKQHRASCKSKVLNPITKPLFMLHMDLFGPTFVSSLMHKKYCLVVTDDYSRFTWVFLLTTKDETSEILKHFIKEIENLVDKKVKIIRSDNGTEFKNKVMDDFCKEKGIKREYSVARTPQQNGVAKRNSRTLIEAARIMLADSKLPTIGTKLLVILKTVKHIEYLMLNASPLNLKFAETHNVIAFLEKPKESDGFTRIIDFLKASSVHYALTVNPIIYTSCIEQFWVTAKVQTVKGVHQLKALVDKKRVIVTESSIRNDLYLDDAEGTDCLPTATIFEELARIRYEKPSQKLTFYKAFFSPQWKYFIHTITQCLSTKSTAWNKFSSSMASLIICLAKNQKFNLSKYIFDAMVKHLDGEVKFLMYLCFLQVFINQQLGNMSTHKKIFVNPFHTKKVFANMKRVGKDFSRRITPLFDTMMVQVSEEVEVPQDKTKHEESVPTPSNDPQPSDRKLKDCQARRDCALKKRIHKIERKKMSRPTGLKRLKKVGMSRRVNSSEDQESLVAPEDASKQGRSIADIDADVKVTLVDETQERQDDNLMFDTRVLDTDEMPVEEKVDEKDEHSTKLDDSTASEAVITANVEDSAAPTTIEEITLAQTLIQI
ncbi:putative ribonuclease H-like domain-containing protein [Tanacetum coccineum]